ncbi:hypothetical protein E4U55_004065, partial [Claviceps digitariae]
MQFAIVLSALAGLALANPVVDLDKKSNNGQLQAADGTKVSADTPSKILAERRECCTPYADGGC